MKRRKRIYYTDTQKYTNDVANGGALDSIEASLSWGVKLSVVVGDAIVAGDSGVVCLQQTSASGTVFSIGDIAAGASAGTYYGKGVACPAAPTPANVSALGTSW